MNELLGDAIATASIVDIRAEADKRKSADNSIGAELQKKWDHWFLIRRQVEEEWLHDLRSFNQIPESGEVALSQFHSHVYVGLTRTKAMTAYANIMDLANSDHWGIEQTPVPEGLDGVPLVDDLSQMVMAQKAKLMQSEMQDQMLELDYDGALSAAVLEACIIGTGIIKGVTPDVKLEQSWQQINDEWIVVPEEKPFPSFKPVSPFEVYPDPYATTPKDISGVFERHVLNRKEFSELRDNPQFDADVIAKILRDQEKGNHTPLYHETERRKIAGITDSTASSADRFDVLEYWGQVSGSLLIREGIEGVDDPTALYWANVWVCQSVALLVKLMPMAKQRIPYNFFCYQRIPHQFWGIPPGRMMRDSQTIINGAAHALLDNMAIASGPQVEANVGMLKQGDDPKAIKPWKIWLRDRGDPSEPAVRFYQPNPMVNDLINVADQFRKYADEESSLPSYTHGEQIQGANKTASGMSMMMGASNINLKAVIRNLETYLIKPLIESLFDWNMQWSDREDIKGDLQVDVKLSSSVIAKEIQSQRLIQYLQLTANPIDVMLVDRRYLLKQCANTLDIDSDKAVPNGQEPSTGAIQPVMQTGMEEPHGGMFAPATATQGQPGNAFIGQGAALQGPM